MIDSGIKLRQLAAAVLAVGALMGAPSVWAQNGTSPVQLLPPDTLPVTEGGPIAVDELGTVDPDTLGLLNGGNGGLGVGMWRNSSHGIIAKLLPQAPVTSSSPAMHALASRLLQTTAEAPVLAPGAAGKKESLLPQRINHLVAMGETGAVLRMLAMLPPDLMTEELLRAKVNSLLVEAQGPAACAEAQTAVARFNAPYWQKVMVLCHLMAGDVDRASLSVDLLRESGHDDPAFFAGADTMLGLRELSVSGMADPSPLHVSLLAATGRPLPPDILQNGSPAILRAVALNEAVDAEMRTRAAELAVGVGVMEAAQVAALYGTFEFTGAEFKAPLTEATPDKGVRARALLHYAAVNEARPEGKAEIMGQALDQAYKDGLFFPMSKILAPLLMEMKPVAKLAWFSGRAARALYAAGYPAVAKTWVELAQDNSYATSDAAIAAATLWPLARLAEYQWDKPWPGSGLREWNEAQREVAAATAAQRRSVLLNLFAAFGEPLDPSEWEEILGFKPLRTTTVPGAALWHGLEVAAKDERVGQTLLMSLIALGEGGPASASSVTLQHVVTNLRRVGLDAEARQLALEAALASGA